MMEGRESQASLQSSQRTKNNADLVGRAFMSVSTLHFSHQMALVPKEQKFYTRHTDKTGAFLEPEIVVYGSTPGGQRTCVHVHGFLPFFYFRPKNLVQAEQLFASKIDIEAKLSGYKDQLEIALSQKSDSGSGNQSKSENFPRKRAKVAHIAGMSVVQRRSIYGQEDLSWYVLVEYYNPWLASRCAEVLDEGCLDNIAMQTFETHIPYILQFLLKYKIRPTDWLHVEDVRFRGPMPMYSSDEIDTTPSQERCFAPDREFNFRDTDTAKVWDLGNIDTSGSHQMDKRDFLGSQDSGWWSGALEAERRAHPLLKETSCSLEVDVHVLDILNQHMDIGTFGIELWDAQIERARLRGEEPELPPTPQYTNSHHDFPLIQSTRLTHEQHLNRFAALRDEGNRIRAAAAGRGENGSSQLSLGEISQHSTWSPSVSQEAYRSEHDEEESHQQQAWSQGRGEEDSELQEYIATLATQQERDDLVFEDEDVEDEVSREDFNVPEQTPTQSPLRSAGSTPRRKTPTTRTPTPTRQVRHSALLESASGGSESGSIGRKRAKSWLAAASARGGPSTSSPSMRGVVEDEEDVAGRTRSGIEGEGESEDEYLVNTMSQGTWEESPARGSSSVQAALSPPPISSRRGSLSPNRSLSSTAASVSPLKPRSDLRRLDSFVPTGFTASTADGSEHRLLESSPPCSTEKEGENRVQQEESPLQLHPGKEGTKESDGLDINALIGRSSLLLSPQIRPPSAASLTPLWKLGLEDRINVKPHYSHTPDDPGLRNHYSRDFQRYLDRRVFRDRDVPYFDSRPRPTSDGTGDDVSTSGVRAMNEGALEMLRSLPRPWQCSVCTHINNSDMNTCEACRRRRSSGNSGANVGDCSSTSTRQGASSQVRDDLNIDYGAAVLLPTFYPPNRASVEATVDQLELPSTGREGALRRGFNRQRGCDLQSITPTGQSAETQAMGMNVHLAEAAKAATKASNAASKKKKVIRHQSTSTSDSSQHSATTASSTSHHLWRTHHSVLSVEVHAASNSSDGQRLPDPALPQDHVQVIACVLDRVEASESSEQVQRMHWMAILLPEGISSPQQQQVVAAAKQPGGLIPPDTRVLTASREDELFRFFVEMVREADPDFLVGYELQYKSLGFLLKRFKYLKRWHPELPDLARELGRTPWTRSRDESIAQSGAPAPDPSLGAIYVEDHDSGVFITGRTVINLWRRMRSELKLMNYSVYTVASHLLHRNVPEFTQEQMHVWFSKMDCQMRALRHIFRMTRLNLELLEKQDLIRRSSESARLFNIDLWSVLTRGSQFRVEAALLKLAHQEQYIAISPSANARDNQRPICQIPLVMEPASNFYSNPVVVLDFQSLYPSMMINYNLCFSTVQGTLKKGPVQPAQKGQSEGCMGVFRDFPEEQVMRTVLANAGEEDSVIAPNGTLFAPPRTRMGVFPRLQRDILACRQMLKRAMKRISSSKETDQRVLYRVLDAQQYAIKMLSNVIYGYCAASFSGRMPCVDLADAIVSFGRATLEWAMDLVKRDALTDNKWGPLRIVYGDTDSMFIELIGRNREDAFRIGRDIAATISALSPPPVVLKFEKVYMGSVLVTKKRYSGHTFETESDLEGFFEAKGIEVARRDQCGLVVKLQERALRVLYSTRDLSLVKKYLETQWNRVLNGAVPLRDFVYSKEVRLDTYKPNSEPPGAMVANRARERDRNDLPPQRWRLPWVAITRPGIQSKDLPFRDLVMSPAEYLSHGDSIQLNTHWYITKQLLPALHRVLSLAGADVSAWWDERKRAATGSKRYVSYPPRVSLAEFIRGAVDVEKQDEQPGRNRHNDSKQHRPDQQRLQTTIVTYLKLCRVCRRDLGNYYVQQAQLSRPAGAQDVCADCLKRRPDALMETLTALQSLQIEDAAHAQNCHSCCGFPQPSEFLVNSADIISRQACTSVQCKHFYRRVVLVKAIEDKQLAVKGLEQSEKDIVFLGKCAI